MTSIRSATEQTLGFAALYVVGPPEAVPTRIGDNRGRWPIRFGVTSHPRNIVSQARSWNWHGVELLGLWWTTSQSDAERLRDAIATEIDRYAEWRHGAWHDVSVTALELWLRHLAELAGIELFDEDERQRRIETAVSDALIELRRNRDRRRA